MRTDQMRESENVEDRRGMGGMGGGGRMAVGGGIGGIILVVVVILLGGNPQQLLNQMGGSGGGGGGGGGGGSVPGYAPTTNTGTGASPAQANSAELVARVLGDTEDVWRELFRAHNMKYVEPKLVLFSGSVRSACGMADAAVGPFYCPEDAKVYIDLTFFDELATRFGAPGDFAQAYVIAHEVGHHVQNLMGISDRVHAMRATMSKSEYNQMSVRLELQADFLAGVWAHHAQKVRNILEKGDVEEAVRCAAAIGDDRLQKQARGTVVPDSFTHGTSEQRARWFRKGLESGDMTAGDTFNIPSP